MNYVILIIDMLVVNLHYQINNRQYEKDIYNKRGAEVRTFRWKI
jgi:hypothetical protein